MKKGILTFHNCANYGAVFQAYALWRTLSSLSSDTVELIDYTNPKISTSAQINRMENEHALSKKIKNLIALPYIKRKNKCFQSFLRTQAHVSENNYTSENISNCEKEYDTVFFGSDQIWNMELTGNDLRYYGNFSNRVHKIAYAASLGKGNIRNSTVEIGSLLQQFDAIATREKRDQNELKEIFDIDVQHVLDPTLLLEASDWIKLESPIRIPERYVLLYLISPRKSDFSFAKQLGKKLGLPVLYVSYSWKRYPGVVNLHQVSPEQFLYLLHHAQLIVTNSFHGTVLSINFQKNFYWQNHARAGRANARVTEILEYLDLNDRIVTDGVAVSSYEIKDWSVPMERLRQKRKDSLNYLCQTLEDTYRE